MKEDNLFNIFVNETMLYISEIEAGLKSHDKFELAKFQRYLHSLKGNARSLELFNIESIIHSLEDHFNIADSSKINQKIISIYLNKLKLAIENLKSFDKKKIINIQTIEEESYKFIKEYIQDSGKKIYLDFSYNEDISLSPEVLNISRTLIMHLLRNACEHGAAFKDEECNVQIQLNTKEDHLNIHFKDDGRGLDLDKIKELAKKENIFKDLNLANEKELYSLIFLPGFSTSEKLTMTSGRGIGLDVVKSYVEDLGGKMSFESKKGKGVTFNLSIPI